MATRAWWTSFAVAVTAVAGACSAGRDAYDAPTNSFEADAAPEADACAALRCSRDLKSVVRGCDGEVSVETCAAGLGCSDGTCVEACRAIEGSKGSYGCSFYALSPELTTGQSARGSCFAALVANTWDAPATLSAELRGQPVDLSRSTYRVNVDSSGARTYTPIVGALAPGEIATVFLVYQPDAAGNVVACPAEVKAALSVDPQRHGTTVTNAFHLASDVPVSIYSVFPYGGAASHISSATLLLPTTAWDTSYVAVDPWEKISLRGVDEDPFLQIVARENDTEVRIRPSADMSDGDGLRGVARGEVAKFTLAKGEVLQIVQGEELIGSPIETSKPVGLFGGSTCMFVPGDKYACDAAQQQIPPVSQWGHEYAMVPHRGRSGTPESVPWRIVGGASGTILTYDPQAPAGAPTAIGAGEVARFWTSTPFVMRSQDSEHPFYAAAYMTGATKVSDTFVEGDPEFVNVIATEQYLDRYVFFVDYTFDNNWLAVVRRRSGGVFEDVTIDCAGPITGWQNIDAAGQLQYANVALTSGNQPVSYGDGGKSCGPGRREATSKGPFSVTVWGTAYFSSYAYPAGTGSRPITGVRATVPR